MKIGIFPGSFNPPHIGHFNIAEALYINKIVDKVIFIPTSDYYHKKDLASAQDRFNMLKILTEKSPHLEASNIEINKDEQNYTYQTLDTMQSMHPNDEIYLIMGSDNLSNFNNWYRYDYILDKYKIVCISRKINNDLIDKYKDKVIFLNLDMDISSTEIRNMLYNNLDTSKFLKEETISYIKKHNLYKGWR